MSSEGSGQELVVVGVDGSAESVAAPRWTARYAGRGAFTGMLLGSVSIHCVTGAFCPVVVVRASNGN
jgi:nucleotide-binding universal stress UspA family protein